MSAAQLRPMSHSPFRASRTEIVRTSTSPIRGRVMNPPVMERVSSMKKSVRFEGDGVGSLGRT
jgi:hypothetical protein